MRGLCNGGGERTACAKMPPRRGESIERTDEHEEFVKKVAEYHEKRGYVCQLYGEICHACSAI